MISVFTHLLGMLGEKKLEVTRNSHSEELNLFELVEKRQHMGLRMRTNENEIAI